MAFVHRFELKKKYEDQGRDSHDNKCLFHHITITHFLIVILFILRFIINDQTRSPDPPLFSIRPSFCYYYCCCCCCE